MFSCPWPFAWLPALALNLFTNPGPIFVCTGPGPEFVFNGPGPNFYLPTLVPAMIPDLYLPVQVKILLLPQLLVLSLLLPLTPLLLLLLLLLIIIIIRDAITAAKFALNGPEKIFDEKVKPCVSKFVSVMANVFLIREAAVIFQEI